MLRGRWSGRGSIRVGEELQQQNSAGVGYLRERFGSGNRAKRARETYFTLLILSIVLNEGHSRPKAHLCIFSLCCSGRQEAAGAGTGREELCVYSVCVYERERAHFSQVLAYLSLRFEKVLCVFVLYEPFVAVREAVLSLWCLWCERTHCSDHMHHLEVRRWRWRWSASAKHTHMCPHMTFCFTPEMRCAIATYSSTVTWL